MIKPQQPVSAWHVVPLMLGSACVLLTVDVGKVLEMGAGEARLVYSLQTLLAIAVYFGLCLMNFLDIEPFYPQRMIGGITKALPALAYFLFIARVWLLSAIEAETVLLLSYRWHDWNLDSGGTKLAVIAVLLFCVALHVGAERKRLGRSAWLVVDAKARGSGER